MAKRNLREYLRGDTVWLKKYLYVLRPVLACMWIEAGRGAVPMRLSALVDALVDDPRLGSAITELLAQKSRGLELSRGPRIPAISDFIEAQIARLGARLPGGSAGKPDATVLNEFFLWALARTREGE